jgi:hypothetical protein
MGTKWLKDYPRHLNLLAAELHTVDNGFVTSRAEQKKQAGRWSTRRRSTGVKQEKRDKKISAISTL